MKNKSLKILYALLCVAFICLFSAPSARADEPLELHMEHVTAANGELLIYCNSNSETTPRESDFAATLGNAVLPITNVATFGDTKTGASYIFLVDVSGSIKQSQLQGIKDALALICADLTEEDNISIIAVGNETYTQPFVSRPDDIQKQIDAIERSHEDTNLYESVFKSLSILNTNQECRDKKVLVIFSDGEEDSFQGITLNEAAIKIRDSHIPIYTIAMLGKNPSSRYVEAAKILGSFARLSAGGQHYIHTLEKSSSEMIAGGIVDSIRKSLILSVDLAEFRSDGNTMDLLLELTLTGQGRASDGYAIPTAGLSAPEIESPTPSVEPTPAPTPVSTPMTEPPAGPDEIEKTPKPNILVWIIGGSAALLLLIIGIIAAVRRNKAVPPPIPAPPGPASVTAPLPPSPLKPPPGKPRIAIRLTKIGLVEEQVYRAEFAGLLVIGRDASKAALAFQNDDLLSGRHCSISYEPEGVVLRDLGSTNGTFVNGVPIQERHVLENDDIVLIGSMELRVNWEPLKEEHR